MCISRIYTYVSYSTLLTLLWLHSYEEKCIGTENLVMHTLTSVTPITPIHPCSTYTGTCLFIKEKIFNNMHYFGACTNSK